MGTLAINAGDGVASGRLQPALARLAPGAPIVVMVHGFRYCPSSAATDPHRHILADRPATDHWKTVSWPARLGLRGAQGLAVGFGWPASGTIWQAYGRAPRAGADLAALLDRIGTAAPGHPLHLMAHSLGARVGLHAMALAPRRVRRAVLISPACFRAEARRLAPETGAEVFSVLGRENTAYDWMLRAVLPHGGCTLGRGGPGGERWLDLHLGAAHVRAGLARLGHQIAPPRARVCHWSGYLREGVWDLYRALIQRPGETPLPVLRAQLAAPGCDAARGRARRMPWGPGQAV